MTFTVDWALITNYLSIEPFSRTVWTLRQGGLSVEVIHSASQTLNMCVVVSKCDVYIYLFIYPDEIVLSGLFKRLKRFFCMAEVIVSAHASCNDPYHHVHSVSFCVVVICDLMQCECVGC